MPTQTHTQTTTQTRTPAMPSNTLGAPRTTPTAPASPPPNPPTVGGPCAGRDDRSKEVGRGGPRTPAGKAASARNATSHGLFAKHAVLPHLGEDPAEYETLLKHLFDQVRPRNLLERQYLELWAEASWKLRRLSRLEADVWEADALTTAERLVQLERVDRLQSSLRRKMDKAIHMLGPDLPRLFATRTREDLMDHLGLTPSLCASHPYRERDLEDAIRAHRTCPDPSLTDPKLSDAVPTNTPEATPETKNCQSEPIVPAVADTVGAHGNAPILNGNAPNSAHATPGTQNRENEPLSPPLLACAAAEPAAPSPSPAWSPSRRSCAGRGMPEGRGEGLSYPIVDNPSTMPYNGEKQVWASATVACHPK